MFNLPGTLFCLCSCPLTRELFIDPVTVTTSSQDITYERSALADYFRMGKGFVDPITKEELPTITGIDDVPRNKK